MERFMFGFCLSTTIHSRHTRHSSCRRIVIDSLSSSLTDQFLHLQHYRDSRLETDPEEKERV